MITQDNYQLDYKPVSSFVIKILLTAFTVLSAFCIRDSAMDIIKLAAPDSAKNRVLYSLLLTGFFLFLTVLLAFIFQDQIQQ